MKIFYINLGINFFILDFEPEINDNKMKKESDDSTIKSVKRKIILKNKGKNLMNDLLNAENIQIAKFLSNRQTSNVMEEPYSKLTILNCNLNKSYVKQNENKTIQQKQYNDLLKIYENLQQEELKHYYKISMAQETIRKIKRKQSLLKQKLAEPLKLSMDICKEINEKTSLQIDADIPTACVNFIERILNDPFKQEYKIPVKIIRSKLKLDI